MKYVLLLSFAAISFGAGAQTATPAAAITSEAVKPALSKEDKAKQKAQQEQDLTDALKGAGLNEDQMKSVRETLDAANKEGKALDPALTDDQKMAAKKEISERKNNKLKEIMGADGYKKWNEIRKEQKSRAVAGQ